METLNKRSREEIYLELEERFKNLVEENIKLQAMIDSFLKHDDGSESEKTDY